MNYSQHPYRGVPRKITSPPPAKHILGRTRKNMPTRKGKIVLKDSIFSIRVGMFFLARSSTYNFFDKESSNRIVPLEYLIRISYISYKFNFFAYQGMTYQTVNNSLCLTNSKRTKFYCASANTVKYFALQVLLGFNGNKNLFVWQF